MATPRRIVLIHKRAPGDTAVLTALARDIALTRPGEFEVAVDTHAMSLWDNNPHIVSLEELKKRGGRIEHIKATYGQGLRDQNYETVHFLSYFHRDFEVQARVKIPLTLPYPDLHLSEIEKNTPLVNGRYWLFLSGGKSDFTAKVWSGEYWKKTIKMLHELGIPCVQAGGADRGHWHPEISGVLNLVGKTSLRDFIRLIYHADGVICGVTCAMHLAAGLQKPCVVIAGGREAWWWEAYVRENKGLGGETVAAKLTVPHRYLHTIGLLDCCSAHGCWKNKVLPLNGDKSLCKYPIILPQQSVPKCLSIITPEHVVEAVMSYYEDKSLPAIKPFAQIGKYEGRGEIAEIATINTAAEFEKKKPATANTAVPNQTAVSDDEIFDNPIIGGKFTVCILFYGGKEYHHMHMNCLNSIISTCPANRIELRVASNELCKETTQVLDNLVAHGIIKKHYKHEKNIFKYPVMREMFHDPELPITTNYTLWFDDDSIADRIREWLTLLARTIVQKPEAGLFGASMVLGLNGQQMAYYKKRPWYKGKPFRTKGGISAANGNYAVFVAGGFFAIKTEAIKAADVPDPDLTHNGGDYTIGEQLYQNGYNVCNWNRSKQFIHTSSVPRRGESQPHFGTAAWQQKYKPEYNKTP